jgi:hypothetical protein
VPNSRAERFAQQTRKEGEQGDAPGDLPSSSPAEARSAASGESQFGNGMSLSDEEVRAITQLATKPGMTEEMAREIVLSAAS